jgi:hypothetical protein
MAFFQHPRRRFELDDRLVWKVQDGLPLRQRPTAHHRAGGTNLDRMNGHGLEGSLTAGGPDPVLVVAAAGGPFGAGDTKLQPGL